MASKGDLETIKTLQEEEIQVLQAVYDKDFEDLRKNDVWKVWRPAEFTIFLYPSKEGVSADARVYVSLRMHVKFTDSYPMRTPPVIDFQDEKGLPKVDVLALKQRVDKMAESLVGQAMICDLCQYVQEYLHENNRPPDYQSFYEGMLKNQRRREIVDENLRRRLEEEKKEQERIEMEAIEIELRKRQEQRRQEALQRRMNKVNQREENNGSCEAANDHVAGGRSRSTSLPPSSLSSEDPVVTKRASQLETIRDERSMLLFKLFTGSRLKMVVKGKDCTILIGAKLSSTHACNLDFVGVVEETGQLVIVSEWCVKWKRNKAGKSVVLTTDGVTDSFQKDLLALEQEFRGLVKLDHQNLVRYVSISINETRQSTLGDAFRLIYLKEHSVNCLPLSYFLRPGISVQREYVRKLSKDILSALEYLHSRAVLHKDLNEDCVWDCGGDAFLLSDYSVKRRILDLLETYRDNLFDLEPNTDPLDVNGLMVGMGRTSRKSDVFTFGVFLMRLEIGYSSSLNRDGGTYGLLRILDDDSIFPPGDPLKDFIEKMVSRDEDRRWNCTKLLSHCYLTADVAGESGKGDRVLGRRGSYEHNASDNEADEDKDDAAAIWLASPLLGGSTRLETEFDVLKLLGRGGFGDVMKVKNKLDDCVYAIKRVVLNPRSKELNKKIIREVKLLSRLNHENVVRYYNSWIEQRQRMLERERSETSSESTPPSVIEAVRKSPSASAKTPQPRANRRNMVQARLQAKAKMAKKGGLGYDEDEVEDLAPPAAPEESSEWSVSFRAASVDSSSDTDDDDVFGNLFYSKVESNFLDDTNTTMDDVENLVVFENGGAVEPLPTALQQNESREKETSTSSAVEDIWARETRRQESGSEVVQILYIQMEFCQKNTLRQAIDYGELVEDGKRAWRLFREILEGLSYIHHQGMIHRDLKPVNIFLDSHDHVKIGDFGLATKLLATLTGKESAMAALEDMSQSGAGDWANLSNDIQADLTTKIGTALYVSPELCPSPKPTTSTPTGLRIAYTQKVDMYSLGIVLFEMFYRPFKTGMERIMILTDLRRPDILLPSDFVNNPANENRVKIVQLLLQHDADQRPTADELLLSELLPPVEMQPSEFQLTVKQTLSNTQTHQYKWLVSVLLDEQHPSTVQEYVYDADMYDRGQVLPVDALIRQWVEDRLVELFRLYGAVPIETPLLLPKSKILTEHAEARVDIMDRSGCVLHLPYDMRIPFARYAVRNQLVHVKRYCISKVYRDEKRSSHPCQLTECAFDTITSQSGCAAAAAEILALASDVVAEFPELRSQNFVIKLNHTSLLKAIVLYAGIEDTTNMVPILELLTADFGKGGAAERNKRHTKLKNDFHLNDKNINQLLSLLQMEEPLTKISSVLRCITKRKDSMASSFAKEGLHELETIRNNAETLSRRSRSGGLLPIVVSLKLIYNLHEYDGPVFQLVGELKRASDDKKNQPEKASKKMGAMRTFAAGGRYDQLLNHFRKPPRLVKPVTAGGALVFPGGNASTQGAVGISFAFDLIVQLVASTANRQHLSRSALIAGEGGVLLPRQRMALSPYDILVCSIGHKLMVKEKLALVRDFRLARFRCDYLQDPVQHLEDLQDACLRTGVKYLVIIKESEGGVGLGNAIARVRYWDKTVDRAVDKRLPLSELVIFVQEKCQEERESYNEEGSGGLSTILGSTSQYDFPLGGSLDSGQTASNTPTVSNNLSNLKVNYAVLERPPHHMRKRIESQIANILSPVLQKFTAKETLELVASDLPGLAVKQLAAVGEFNRDEGSFRASIADVVSRFNKFKKEFRLVVDLICDLKFFHGEDQEFVAKQQQQNATGRGTVVILYSYTDDCYRFLL